MVVKNIHEKLLSSIETMLIDTQVALPYYGEFNLHVNFHEQDSIGTCGVNVTSKGMNFFYSPKFLKDISQKEVNFITLHEDFHLLFDHPKRTITGQYDHKLSNIAQDMIINHTIWEDINHIFIEIPKDKDGKNMALFVPKEYKGKLIFEELYEWLREEKDKFDKKQKSKCKCGTCDGTGKVPSDKKSQGEGNQPGDGKGKGESKGQGGKGQSEGQEGQGQGEGSGKSEGKGQSGEGGGQGSGGQDTKDCPDCDGSGKEKGDGDGKGGGKPTYGPYGQNPKNEKGAMDTWSTDQIFEDLEKNQGQYLDQHMTDDVPEEMRESMIRDVMERLQSRGLQAGNIETTLNKLRKKRKDYLKEIKRSISNEIFGHIKTKTITKPNRRQIAGLKGNRKIKSKVNVGLDVSGSMGGQGTFERVLSYVYRNDIEINFMESDTQINWVQKIKKKKQLESIPIKGLGGTCLQPMIDYIVEHHNDVNSVLLGDGYCDNLDFSKVKGKVLIISVGVPFPIAKSNGKIKQICIENTH